MDHQVFISYASEKGKQSKNDFNVAEKIYKALQAKNIHCWLAPREIQPGDEWINEIINAVEQSKVVILVFSSNANQSNWVKLEINHALDKNKTIIVFSIENVLPQGTIKLLKSNFQWLEAYTLPLKTHVDRLVEAVQEHLKITPNPPPQDYLINPFTEFMAIHDPARFIGRETELRRLMTLLQGGSVALLGEPKIGKSSLLRHLARHWQGKVIGPLDCNVLHDRDDFYKMIAEALELDKYNWQTIRETLNHSKMLFLLDELDVGTERGITHTDLAFLRSICESNRDFKMVAVSRTPLMEIFPDTGIGSPVFNFLVPFTVGPFNEVEARQLLHHPWAPDVPTFNEDTCDRILDAADNHPFWLQRISFHCYHILVNPEYDWETALQKDVEQMQFRPNILKQKSTLRTFAKEARGAQNIEDILNHSNETVQEYRNIFSGLNVAIDEEMLNCPVLNPYVGYSGLPVISSAFIGRADIIQRIENHWASTEQPAAIILYGHRRMGKTSILRSLANRTDSNTLYVYLDMQNVGWVDHTGQFLLDFAEAIHRTAENAGLEAGPTPKVTNYNSLGTARRDLNALLNKLDPQMTTPKRLVMTIDEFEFIESSIEERRIDSGLLRYLRYINQNFSWLGLIFAGLHTLDEMGRDYHSAFFGQVDNLRVSYLNYNDAKQLITQPHPDFALEYSPGLLEEIYVLTSGQPYLIQRLCWELVTRWNERFLKQGEFTPRILTADDLAPVLTPDFFHSAGYYFEGVWSNVTENERTLMRIMAQREKGPWKIAELVEAAGTKDLEETIELLHPHDVILEEKGGTRIASELMRRWIAPRGQGASKRE